MLTTTQPPVPSLCIVIYLNVNLDDIHEIFNVTYFLINKSENIILRPKCLLLL